MSSMTTTARRVKSTRTASKKVVKPSLDLDAVFERVAAGFPAQVRRAASFGLGLRNGQWTRVANEGERVRWSLAFGTATPEQIAVAGFTAEFDLAARFLAENAAADESAKSAPWGDVPAAVRPIPTCGIYRDADHAEAQELAELGSQVGHDV